MDDFRLSKLLPLAAMLLVQDTEWVRLRKGVHIYEILASKTNLQFLGKATTTEVCCCQDRCVEVRALAHFGANGLLIVVCRKAAECFAS